VPGLVTQNIDNLHQASGIAPQDVVELHGNNTYALCLDCAKRYELGWVREKFEAAGGRAPDCACGGYIKTATISFGQAMCTLDLGQDPLGETGLTDGDDDLAVMGFGLQPASLPLGDGHGAGQAQSGRRSSSVRPPGFLASTLA